MTNTSKIFGSRQPKNYWSQAIDPKLLGRIFSITVKSWFASNLESKILGQKSILGQKFWVNTKTWLSRKLTVKKKKTEKF